MASFHMRFESADRADAALQALQNQGIKVYHHQITPLLFPGERLKSENLGFNRVSDFNPLPMPYAGALPDLRIPGMPPENRSYNEATDNHAVTVRFTVAGGDVEAARAILVNQNAAGLCLWQ